MYKVLIADDEPIIRDNICRSICWGQLGLQLAATAGNGREAAEQALLHQPDIILTDIMMPLVNGLELIKQLRQKDSRAVIIIITGYDEFQYTRAALQLGVLDYILKPIQIEQIDQTLHRAIEVLRSRDTASSKLEQMQRRLEEQSAQLLRLDMQQFLQRRMDAPTLLNKLPAHIDANAWYSCALLQIDDFHHLTNALDEERVFSLSMQVESWAFRENGPLSLYTDVDGRYALLFSGADALETESTRDSYLHMLRCLDPPYAYTTACGHAVQGIVQSVQSYEQACDVLLAAFLSSGNADLTPTDFGEISETFIPIEIGGILQAIPTLNKRQIKQELEQFEQSVRNAGHNSYLFTRLAISHVYSEIVHTLVTLHFPIGRIVNDPTRLYQEILRCQTLSDAVASLYEFVSQVCDALSTDITPSNRTTIAAANAYLQANYQNPKLSLEQTAAAVNLSPNYFSSLYKQTTGRSFISSLTQIRIERAKQLLLTGQFRSYEVAYQCGYDNPAYFSTIFKRHTGLSPSDYCGARTGEGDGRL